MKNSQFPRASLVALLFVASGCVPAPENQVVVYTAVDREFAAPILGGFERQFEQVEVAEQFDVESTKTLGLVTRIESEKAKPICDVFWNNEILHTIRLQKAGLLKKRDWNLPDNWPSGFVASDNSWVGVAARARVLIVNTELLTPDQYPRGVAELADKNWKGQCGMAFPLFGTTATHMTVLATQMPREEFETLAKSMAANAVVLSGNKQVAQAVASGELAWGLTDTDDAIIEKENGKPIAIVFPDQNDNAPGTLFIPNSVAVLKDSPHPVAAELLATYLASQQTEERLAMGSSAQFPIWPTSEEKSRLLEGKAPRWMTVDFESAADNWKQVSADLREWFDRG